jgi:hypothetical protein
MKYVFILFTVLSFTFAFAERGSGNVVSEEREVSGFTGIALVSSGDVVITQGAQESLTIEAEDNLLPLLETTVENGLLVLGVKDGETIQPTKDIRYFITVTNLDRLEISGAGDMSSSDLTLDALSVDISGTGDVSIANLTLDTLSITVSGAGDVDLSGTANSSSITVSGSGDYQACDLQSGTVGLEISGQGDAVVSATGTLTVDVSGMGDVAYVGTPEVSQDVSGMGDVTQISDCSDSEE